MTTSEVQTVLTKLYWDSPMPQRDKIAEIKQSVDNLSDAALSENISNRTADFSTLVATFDKSIIISMQTLINSIKDDVAYATIVNNSLGVLEKIVSSVPL